MEKEIELGDIKMSNWKLGDDIFPEWYAIEERSDIKTTDVVLEPNTEYTLEISYPLSRPFVQSIQTGPEGMTRENFIAVVVLCYKQIYKDEDDSSEIGAGHIPGMYNRVETDGVYGIWGHDLSDLVLCSMYFNTDDNKIILGVDS